MTLQHVSFFRPVVIAWMLAFAQPSAAQPDMMSTKKPSVTSAPLTMAPRPAIAPAKPAPPPSPAPAPDLLTTKPATPSATAPTEITTTKEVAPPQATSPPPTAATAPAATKPEAPAAATPAPDKTAGFLVTAQTKAGETTIHFPFTERTALSVFERGRDIWVVFARATDVNTSLLRTVLPSAVINITQYNYPGNTVLRLATDGRLHGSAEAVKGGYAWNIILAPALTPATSDVPITVDSAENGQRLLLGVFDVAEPLRFYDPVVGDLLVVIPTYEVGRGILYTHTYPQFTLPLTSQGIAVISAADDLQARVSRLGVAISAGKGLTISSDLGVINPNTGPVAGTSSGVLLPYDQWFVAPHAFREELQKRMMALSVATKDARAKSLYSLVTLYLGQGMGSEALGYLQLLEANEPVFYKENKLALLTAAAHALEHQPADAAEAIKAPELDDVKEAELWREYAALFTPRLSEAQKIQDSNAGKPATPYSVADDLEMPGQQPSSSAKDATGQPPEPVAPPTKPIMRFLKFNRTYIRYYPPRLRQQLAIAAADAYIANGLSTKALAAFDTLNRDDLLKPIQRYAEYALATEAIEKKRYSQAAKYLARLKKQNDDDYVKARARVTHALMLRERNAATAEETVDALEAIRMSWRGGDLDREILKTLSTVYKETKRYDDSLRTMRILTDEFPNDPDFLTISGDMSALFNMLYVEGGANDLPPLTSLALFYEFRDLTPIGEKGDKVIQQLADRLAAFDLIGRATQLLENQINFRLGGEERSRVGARLALLYLINKQPQEALKVIEVTNYGANPAPLQRQRLQLAAQALSYLGRYEDALNMLHGDDSAEGQLLKLDILWAAKDWPNVVNRAEDILSSRKDLTAQLTPVETEVLLKLSLGYSFLSDYTQLRYLRDYYSALVPDSGYKQIFEFMTNDTTPLDPADNSMLTQQITRTESFLGLFKDKIQQGKLSEAIK